MIQDIKNICSRKQIKYLTFLFLAMLVAAALEMMVPPVVVLIHALIVVSPAPKSNCPEGFTAATDPPDFTRTM